MIWLLSLIKGILSFYFMSVKLETASYMYIINWTVMLFYKHLCPFWIRYTYMYASILVQLSSFVHHFLSLCWYLLFVLIDHRKGEKKRIILLLLSFLSFLSLSQPKILPASVYTYISIRRSANAYAPLLFLAVLAKFGPDITTILILLFAFAYAYVQE